MWRRLLGRSEEWPPEKPAVYGCDTLEEHMERAAWDIKLHGLKGRPAEACALYDSLFQLEGGDMTASTQVILGFPELVPLALCRREELAARGVNVDELYAATEKTRAFNTAVQTGEIFDIAINSLINPGTDRR